MAPKTAPGDKTLDQRVPTPLQAPLLIGSGLVLTVGLWTLRLGFSSLYAQLGGRVVTLLALAGPALLAFGIFELLYTPDPAPILSPWEKGKARGSVGMDAMLEDIEGRKTWGRRVGAIAIGVVHSVFVRFSS